MRALASITVIFACLVGLGIAVAAGGDGSSSLPWRNAAAAATKATAAPQAPAPAEPAATPEPAPTSEPAATPEPATSPEPAATPARHRHRPRPRRATAITLPDDSARPLNLIYLGDEWLPSYRSAVTAEIVEHRRVIDQELVAPPGTPVTTAAFAQAPAGMDVIVLGVGTQDAAAGTDPSSFGRTYRAIVAGLLAGSPQARLVCVGTYAPSSVALDRRIARSCRHGAFAGVRGAGSPQEIATRVLARIRH